MKSDSNSLDSHNNHLFGDKFGVMTRYLFKRASAIRRRTWLVKYASGLVVLSGIIAVTSNFLNPRAPIYRGRTATEWIRSIDLSKDASATQTACEALRELGSASLPAVLHELQARDYPKYLKPINSLYNACGFWRVYSWRWCYPETRHYSVPV